MGILSAIVGMSGTGKTTSMRNMSPDDTVIIRPMDKALPFRPTGWRTKKEGNKPVNLFNMQSAQEVCALYKKLAGAPHIKNIILDDYQYYGSLELLDKIKSKGYTKFEDVGKSQADLITVASKVLRDDQIFTVIAHDQVEDSHDGNTRRKIKTQGKMVDNLLGVEGYMIAVFYSQVEREDGLNKYQFSTQTDGVTMAKTPLGMFEQPDEFLIDNDWKMISDRMREYYSL